MAVDPNDHVPIYEQIVEYICGSVTAGVYRPGEALPSIRALAQRLVVNPNTIQRAYQELERQGLVEMRRGLGMFVTDDARSSAQRRSEAAVASRFKQGVDKAQAAKISTTRIRSLFNESLQAALATRNRSARSKPNASRSPGAKP